MEYIHKSDMTIGILAEIKTVVSSGTQCKDFRTALLYTAALMATCTAKGAAGYTANLKKNLGLVRIFIFTFSRAIHI